ncbi:MAG TPA: hypothetical protein VHB79_32575 [Polyangiaceae bacterium]|nr:hypothetical protein [Polyangiaceae bacterium]
MLVAVLTALSESACHSKSPAAAPPQGAGGERAVGTGGEPDAGMTSEAGSAPVDDAPASVGLLHAAQGVQSVSWSLEASGGDAAGAESGTLDFAHATRLQPLPPGDYTLELSVGKKRLSRELKLRGGHELNAVLSLDVTSPSDWQLDIIDTTHRDDEADGTAQLFFVNQAAGGARTLDVGIDNLAEPDASIEPASVSKGLPLDVTRPALAFVQDGVVTDDFTLPVPAAHSTVIAVALGDPASDGSGAGALRLLVARMQGESSVDEVRPDPVIYFLHASAAHAGVDLFVGPGNPIKTLVSAGELLAKVRTLAVDKSSNQKLIRAELADNTRFGELRVGRAPTGPATLETYLTIPGDPQLPAPLHSSLTGTLLPNQRLRNGSAIGRQGAQDLGGELQAGAEYLIVLPSNGPWPNNRSQFPNDAPQLPFIRVERQMASAEQASLRIAAGVTFGGSVGLPISLGLDDQTVISGALPFELGDPRDLQPGAHHLTLDIQQNPRGIALPQPATLDLDLSAGQDLLVIATGDAQSEPITVPESPRPDDQDADGTVAAEVDPETQLSLDPNYLPADGDSELIQDDCPTVPGPLSHFGCPPTGLHWLVVDLSTKPPTVLVQPIN